MIGIFEATLWYYACKVIKILSQASIEVEINK